MAKDDHSDIKLASLPYVDSEAALCTVAGIDDKFPLHLLHPLWGGEPHSDTHYYYILCES